MTAHSTILAWKIPWSEKPVELRSIGSHRVRHGWAYTHTHTYTSIWCTVNAQEMFVGWEDGRLNGWIYLATPTLDFHGPK